MKRALILITAVLSLATLSACTNKGGHTKTLENCAIHHDDEFGGAYIDISIQDFNNLGFKFGDSINISFTTKKTTVTFEDVGYYSGYYVPAGKELLVGYKGYDYIKFCINYGEDIYAESNLSTTTTATINLLKSGKYLSVEETLSISYSDDRLEYTSDEQFANFRPISVGLIKNNYVYRGASPIDNSRKRTAIVDSLLEKNGIKYNIDLADKKESIGGSKYEIHDYFQSLLDEDKVIFLGMAAAYKAEDFSNKMKNLFLSILNNDGPYYIHCLEGKDRTGFVCMVIEALCGASYEELIEDYFTTYKNYYGIEEGSEKYNVIKELHIDEMIRYVFGFEENKLLLRANFHSMANNYLLNVGLTQDQVDALQLKLTE